MPLRALVNISFHLSSILLLQFPTPTENANFVIKFFPAIKVALDASICTAIITMRRIRTHPGTIMNALGKSVVIHCR